MSRVLVIDACPDFRAAARGAFDRAGFDVVEASDALAGLQRAVEDEPDVIVVDADLPGLDGLEVCRRLRGEPRTRDVAIVVWGDSRLRIDRRDAFEAGASAWLARSLPAEGLVEPSWALVRWPMRSPGPSSRPPFGGAARSGR